MYCSIGEVANGIGGPTATMGFCDREGLFNNSGRSNGGIRVFTDVEVESLKIVECLKLSGMPIKDIKRFLDWC